MLWARATALTREGYMAVGQRMGSKSAAPGIGPLRAVSTTVGIFRMTSGTCVEESPIEEQQSDRDVLVVVLVSRNWMTCCTLPPHTFEPSEVELRTAATVPQRVHGGETLFRHEDLTSANFIVLQSNSILTHLYTGHDRKPPKPTQFDLQ